MSKAVMYMGREQEFQLDDEVRDVTIADGLVEIELGAFCGCTGLKNLSFLERSAITTVGRYAFQFAGVVTLLGMEGVGKIGFMAFYECKDLRNIEGLSCEEMGDCCFEGCKRLQSMMGWPASMTVIPARCFNGCNGMTAVDCDLSHVTSIGVSGIGYHAFAGCTSLLPPSLSKGEADPTTVLGFLKRMSFIERAAERHAFLASLKHAQSDYYNRTGNSCGASRRLIMEFAGLFPA